MNGHDRLKKAMKAQFDWIPILITDRKRSTPLEKKRALIYAFIPFVFLLVLVVQTWHPLMVSLGAFLLQAVATLLTVLYHGFVLDYSNETTDPSELERLLNPIIVATFSIRLFATLHALMVGAWILLIAYTVEFAYVYYAASRGSLLVDATTVWKDIKRIRWDTYYRLAIELFLVLSCIANLLYTILAGKAW
ncbi:hypothetical protein STCU_02040 [Strigomonas culicis]|uniref:Uncharacterized protein n=1 Tax=Strigomonas culicis TaxID=28005 RepID=S9W301_9TRYP|nr:hypothetical protein STCU_02040 [Strigomonas culicis]|eukprot:EPY33726.1 hypothetical protein STCU_02040 [Strigomonas culicis]